jgi:hypothetical protein
MERIDAIMGRWLPAPATGPGSVYMLLTSNKVEKGPSCKKTPGSHNVPCVDGAEQDLGSAAHDSLYTQDTVYFTGRDPGISLALSW